jgi:hypothetical protein
MPERDRDIETRLQAKLESLSEIEIRDRDDEDVEPGRVYRRPRRIRASGPAVSEKRINCDAGQSVNKALKNLPGREVVLHLSGTCRESVVVDRPGVTLSGTVYGPGVIDPPEDADGIPIGPAIYAIGAHELTLEDLTLRGGTYGFEADASRRMQLTRVNVIENQVCPDCPWGVGMGINLRASEAEITDSNLSSNVVPLWANNHSTAIVTDTVMENNSGDGPFSAFNSNLTLIRCRLMGNLLGPQAYGYSSTWVYDSVVESPGYGGWSGAWQTGDLQFARTEIHGRIYGSDRSRVVLRGVQLGSNVRDGRILVTRDTSLFIHDSSQDGNPVIGEINGSIALDSSSFAEIWTDGPIRADIGVYGFSDAWIATSQAIDGRIDCLGRSRVDCNLHPMGGIHGCE